VDKRRGTFPFHKQVIRFLSLFLLSLVVFVSFASFASFAPFASFASFASFAVVVVAGLCYFYILRPVVRQRRSLTGTQCTGCADQMAEQILQQRYGFGHCVSEKAEACSNMADHEGCRHEVQLGERGDGMKLHESTRICMDLHDFVLWI
jgi:hypothetical protein